MSTRHSNICIEASDVSFCYNSEPVLVNVSFSVASADYVGIIGPNGGGKTTLLKLLLGLCAPSSGSISIYGHSVSESKEHFEIGYVPQNISHSDVAFPATVREVVRSGRTARRGLFSQLNEADENVVSRIIDLAGIAPLAKKSIGALSGGERQRVFIARALAGEPRILFLDEPTVGVDIAAQETFYKFLARLNQEHGLTIVLVSHDVDVVAKQVKNILCINKQLVCHIPSAEFDKRSYLAGVYGKEVKPVDHDHAS